MLSSIKNFLRPKQPVEVQTRKSCIELPKYTPDNWRLEEFYFQNVFLYGELKQGCRNFSMVDGNAVRQGIAFTKEMNFVMVNYHNGSVSAVALQVNETQLLGKSSFLGEPARLCGQLFTTTPTFIRTLDNYYQNTVMFKRVRVKLELTFRYKNGNHVGPPITEELSAWTYLGKDDVWLPRMDAQQQVMKPVEIHENENLFSNEKKRYYFHRE